MMKEIQPKSYGPHPFGKKEKPAIPSLINNFEEVPTPSQEISESFKFNKCETLTDDAKIRIFLFSEFSKRKFYLDCLMGIDSNGYIQSSTKTPRYEEIQFSSINECIEYISNTFIIQEERRYFNQYMFNTNQQFVESLQKFNFNIYKSIKYSYKVHIEILKNLINFPDNFSTINVKDRAFLKSQSKDMTSYSYEILLYMMATIRIADRKIEYNSNILKRVIKALDLCWFYFDLQFLRLFQAILDRYSIYLCDLFNITNMDIIINNGYILENFPRFCFLPLEPKTEPYIEKRVKFDVDTINDNINISINLSVDMDSTALIAYIHDALFVSLYHYKEARGKRFSVNEINMFINGIDFDDKYNKISNPKNYINGLLMWDKINLENSKKSISNIIKILLNHLEENSSDVENIESVIKRYRRYYDTVKKCIEDLKLYRITS